AQLDRQRFWGMTLDGATLLTAFNRGGPEAYWRERLAQMGRHQDAPAFVNAAFATAWCHLEDYDQALNYVERMVDAHVGGAVFIGVDRTLAKMRGIPRYDAVLRRVGSPLAQKA
ncbi:MAG: hypothetical protein H0W18_01440, partial [Acidobacteria bacterium]|nr:hypothetical protein [Acidobacteriota bacterium]